MGNYLLRETVAPFDDGYVTSADIRFTVTNTGAVQTIGMADDYTKVSLSKTDIVTGKEIEGARMVLLDADGNVVDQWTSTGEPHEIKYLPVGRYVLREEQAPNDQGYVHTEDISFEVSNTGEIQKVEMKDDFTKVSISKIDITNGKELPGAHLKVTDSSGNIIDEWISTDEPHYIEYMAVGKYILTEMLPADGFASANEVCFSVSETGEIQKVVMEDDITKVEISKRDITTGEELPDAHLKVTDADGNVIDEWISANEPHLIEKLVVGRKYTLTETLPADGYATANSIEFIVADTAEVQHVQMEDDTTKVEISKKDITTGEELPGAHLKVTDADGNVIEEWVSTDKPHLIEKLVVGKKYVLTETLPANGYATAESIEFSVDDTGKVQHVQMEDDVTKISIRKVDSKTGKALAGATLQLQDADGNVLDEWVSTTESHPVTKLTVGKVYTLIEIKAPDKYKLAEPVQFIVLDTAQEQIVEMSDEPVPGVLVPKTGDDTVVWPMILLLELSLVVIGVIVGYFIRRRRKVD